MALKGFTAHLLRFPILILVAAILLIEILLYTLLRTSVVAFEFLTRYIRRSAPRQLIHKLRHATNFLEWQQAARQLDVVEGRERWKDSPAEGNADYDHQLIVEWMETLRLQREEHDYDSLLQTLQSIFASDNPAGINNTDLYNATYFGTKHIVNDFVASVLEALVVVRDAPQLELSTRLAFFKRARQSYGRTALMLSGGASLGYFHIGLIKTLFDAKLLPQVLAGASCGALISSFVGVRTDEELKRDLFTPDSYKYFTACEEPKYVLAWRFIRTSFTTEPDERTKLRQQRLRKSHPDINNGDLPTKTVENRNPLWRFFRTLTSIRKVQGHMFDVQKWSVAMQHVTLGNTTFIEAYNKTGRIINISLTPSNRSAPPIILNYRTTPNVVIWTAVIASAAFPAIIPPVELQSRDPRTGETKPFHIHGKRWADGSLKNDIPAAQIAKLWNAHFLIVSQTNPHVLPFFFNTGTTGRPSQHQHGSGLRGGFVINAIEKILKSDLKKWIALLGELNLLPDFFGADWRELWTQPLTGNITIVPQANLRHMMRVLSDPSRADMADYILRAEQSTWPALVRISNHLRLERMIADSFEMLRKQHTQQIESIPIDKKHRHHNANDDRKFVYKGTVASEYGSDESGYQSETSDNSIVTSSSASDEDDTSSNGSRQRTRQRNNNDRKASPLRKGNGTGLPRPPMNRQRSNRTHSRKASQITQTQSAD